MKNNISLNIKKYFDNFINAFRGMFTTIPVTFCVIIIMNVFIHIYMILSEHYDLISGNGGVMTRSFVIYMSVFAAFTAVGTFFTEIALISLHNLSSQTTLQNKTHIPVAISSPIHRVFGTVISTFIAAFISYKICGYFFITAEKHLLDVDEFSQRTALCVAGYVITLLCITLYFLIKRSRLSFFEYAMHIFVKYFQIYIVSVVLLVGMALITFIIAALFFPSNADAEIVWEIYSHFAALIGGIYALLFSVYALIEPECDVSRFMEILVKYVMHILSLTAYVIIYIYMLKILLLREIPSNSVFEICTALFVCSMVIAIMCLSFEVKGFLQKAAKLLPYVFSPFILLQIYSAGARIKQYGVTPQRYIGVVFIIFEIIYIIIYAVSSGNALKRHIHVQMSHIFLVIALLAAFSAFVPGLNVLTVSKNSQVKAIKQYLADKDAASKALLRKAKGAVYYIDESDYGTDYLNKIISEEKIQELSKRVAEASYDNDNEAYRNYITIYGHRKLDSVDVSGYDMMYRFAERAELKSSKPADLNDIRFVLTDDDDKPVKSYSCNFKPLYDEYMAIDEDEMTNVFIEGNNCVELSDGSLLYMSEMNLSLTTDSPSRTTKLYGDEPEVESLYIQGYILEKTK